MRSKFTSGNIMNRIILLLFAFSLLDGCGQKSKNPVPEQDVQPITVSDFIRDAGPYVEQTVQISGTVVHVCRHGGQRLFIVGDDGDKRIRITTGEDIAEFDVELEGETIEVVGLVREQIAESGKNHLSDYWIETIEYKVVED